MSEGIIVDWTWIWLLDWGMVLPCASKLENGDHEMYEMRSLTMQWYRKWYQGVIMMSNGQCLNRILRAFGCTDR